MVLARFGKRPGRRTYPWHLWQPYQHWKHACTTTFPGKRILYSTLVYSYIQSCMCMYQCILLGWSNFIIMFFLSSLSTAQLVSAIQPTINDHTIEPSININGLPSWNWSSYIGYCSIVICFYENSFKSKVNLIYTGAYKCYKAAQDL